MLCFRECLSVLILFILVTVSAGQQLDDLFGDSESTGDEVSAARDDPVESRGPLKDVSYELLWLIESNDANRKPYSGRARGRLTKVGFGRLVSAGSVRSSVTIGQKSVASGQSRYGRMIASTSMLNTTEANKLQINVDLKTQSKTPISVNTTVRVPLGHWFLLGAADSRVGVPLHESDGNRSVLIMRITNGALLLD